MSADSAFLEFPQKRTEFSDQTYAILGRALSYATLFEAVCRCLSSLQHIRVRVAELSDQKIDDPFALATQEIWDQRLRKHLKKILEYHEFPSDVAGVLKKAKTARNQIAHEVCLGIQKRIESDDGRDEIVSTISDLVVAIASGMIIVEITSLLETNEPCPSVDFLSDYPSRIVSWIVGP
jgi:hypothetical protein